MTTIEALKEWSSAIITMPWGMRLYRWKDIKENGYPKTVDFLNLETNEWEECKNINVFLRIKSRKL